MPPTPRELELIAAFIKAGFDLAPLLPAPHDGVAGPTRFASDEELIAFTSSPTVREHLARLRTFSDLADHLFNARRRRKAIDHLADILDKQTDLVERRKAAASLLRRTEASAQLPRESRDPRAGPLAPSPAHLLSCSPADDPSAPAPPPSHRLDSSPHALINALAAAIGRETSTAARIIKDTLADGAQLNDDPLTQENFCRQAREEPLASLVYARAMVPFEPEHDATSCQAEVIAVGHDGRASPFLISLTRNPLTSTTERWRILGIRTPRPDRPHQPPDSS